MDVASQRRVLAALEEALDQPHDARDAWLASTFGDEPDLRTAVLRLLAADHNARGFMPTEPPPDLGVTAQPPPDRVGPYQLTALLGEGGMSRVYLGQRDDGLFEQVVAVKLMSAGLYAGAMNRLFDRERRVMARLRHPNIGQIYDGGVLADGVPYFIMERLVGTAIDVHVQAHALNPREIVILFMQVCAAVQHAHANLVVHADIKLSNVMVDAEGRVKLLDFGIAQLLEETGEHDAPPALPMTPAYASPARLAGATPVPADDVFALGTLLHDLLVGGPPGQAPRQAPSATVLALAGADASRRVAHLRGDLDAIVLKAIAADPTRRYASVEALANDLTLWLERRPVAARNPDWRLSAKRYLQRHPRAMAALAAAVLTLIAGAAVVTGLYIQAREARAAAERRFDDVRGLANYVLFDLNTSLQRTPQSLALRRQAAEHGQRYLDRLSADPKAPLPVRLEAVDGLVRLADLQWTRGRQNLGEPKAALANLDRAAAIAGQLAEAYPKQPEIWRAEAQMDLARVALLDQANGDTAGANAVLAHARVAIATFTALAVDPEQARRLSITWSLRAAELSNWQGRYVDAGKLAKQAIAKLEAHPSPDVQTQLDLAAAYDVLAESTYYMNDERGAEAPYRREVLIIEALARAHPDDTTIIRAITKADWALGTTLVSIGKGQEAVRVLSSGLAAGTVLLAFDAQDDDARRSQRILQLAMAQALAAIHRYPEAITAMQASVQSRRELATAAPNTYQAARDLAISLVALGDIQAQAGRRQDACATYSEGLQVFTAIGGRGQLTDLDRRTAMPRLAGNTKSACERPNRDAPE